MGSAMRCGDGRGPCGCEGLIAGLQLWHSSQLPLFALSPCWGCSGEGSVLDVSQWVHKALPAVLGCRKKAIDVY